MTLSQADIETIRGLLKEVSATTEPKGSMSIESNSKGNNYYVHLYTSDTPDEIKALIAKTVAARMELERLHTQGPDKGEDGIYGNEAEFEK